MHVDVRVLDELGFDVVRNPGWQVYVYTPPRVESAAAFVGVTNVERAGGVAEQLRSPHINSPHVHAPSPAALIDWHC